MPIDFSRHPCFDDRARGSFARVHLPVAPRCNVQCNFCDRRCDCVNESRPGVTSAVLTPENAVAYWRHIKARRPDLSVVGIAGPGDPFANADETLDTLRRIRAEDAEVLLCVATNGLGLLPHIDELIRLRVSHVTLTVNAVDPTIGARIYAWVRHERRVRSGPEAAAILWERQAAALDALRGKELLVKINSILLPGINDDHIDMIARVCAERGASIMNVIPVIPVPGSVFAPLRRPTPEEIHRAREVAGRYLPQMAHCARCRADACGKLGEGNDEAVAEDLRAFALRAEAGEGRCCPTRAEAGETTSVCETASVSLPEDARAALPHIAVASREGRLVNQHLGEAEWLHIYAASDEGFRLVERRPAPPRGGGDARWGELAERLADCRALLVGGIGPIPRRVLEARGMPVVEMEGLIEDGLAPLFEGRPLPGALQRRFRGCGAACSGGGGGCG